MASNAAVYKRRSQILDLVNHRGSVSVEELTSTLGVSAITIRRDLDHLCHDGSLMRKHGKAVSVTYDATAMPEKKLSEKDDLNIEEKLRIAQKAASFVAENDIVFMNSGSTTLCFLRALRDKRIKVITNNAAAIASEHSPSIELMILGGEYREQSQSLVGEFALNAISNIYADHTFLGTNGISLEKGLTTSVYQECSVNQAMIDHTHGQVVVLADSSKMGKVANFVSSPLSKIDVVVTDAGCPDEYREGLKALGIRVVIT
ncbi:MAG: DeoR family transcriptional regulator [Spirochaetes bacterium]|nr:MAG: DeoR family transcriptional regulator [Spirochaetota bacterium]